MGFLGMTGMSGMSGMSGIVTSTPPTITSSASPSVVEGTTAVVTVTATGGQTPYVFSISGGADADLFTINSSTGALAFASAPDFTDPQDAGTNNVYNVTVKVASAGGAFSTQDIAVTVTYDPAEHFDDFLVPSPTYCFSNAAGTTPCGEGDAILCWKSFGGRSFSKASASGFTLEKSNGEWYAKQNGSGYLRSSTGGTAYTPDFTMSVIIRPDVVNTTQLPINLGDYISNDKGRAIVLASNARIDLGNNNLGLTGTSFVTISTWTEITITGDEATDTAAIYHDGASGGSGSVTLTAFTSTRITIGAYDDGAIPFNGGYAAIGLKSSIRSAAEKTAWDTYAAARIAVLSA